MICNVCGEDKRCYMLSEMNGGPMYPQGLMFLICTGCLEKLISGTIRTEKTVMPDPEKTPEHPFVRRFLDRMRRREESR